VRSTRLAIAFASISLLGAVDACGSSGGLAPPDAATGGEDAAADAGAPTGDTSCFPGTDPITCGFGGSPCTGCCVGNICAQGNQSNACGIGGAACQDCATDVCIDGHCVCGLPTGGPCDAGSDWRVRAQKAARAGLSRGRPARAFYPMRSIIGKPSGIARPGSE
jgi:hypothetical protein